MLQLLPQGPQPSIECRTLQTKILFSIEQAVTYISTRRSFQSFNSSATNCKMEWANSSKLKVINQQQNNAI